MSINVFYLFSSRCACRCHFVSHPLFRLAVFQYKPTFILSHKVYTTPLLSQSPEFTHLLRLFCKPSLSVHGQALRAVHWVLEAKWNRAHVRLALLYDGVRDILSSYHTSLPSCSLAVSKNQKSPNSYLAVIHCRCWQHDGALVGFSVLSHKRNSAETTDSKQSVVLLSLSPSN